MLLRRHATRLDRPVDANGKPFAIQSLNALRVHGCRPDRGSTPRSSTADLLTAQLGNPQVFRPVFDCAQERDLHCRPGPRSLVLFGNLEDGRITKRLPRADARYLSILADAARIPYVASYTSVSQREGASGRIRADAQQTLTGFVKWPDRSSLPDDAPDPDDPRAFLVLQADAGR